MNLGQKPVYLIYIIENVSPDHLPYDICNFLNMHSHIHVNSVSKF